jgi:hypothetical protein
VRRVYGACDGTSAGACVYLVVCLDVELDLLAGKGSYSVFRDVSASHICIFHAYFSRPLIHNVLDLHLVLLGGGGACCRGFLSSWVCP